MSTIESLPVCRECGVHRTGHIGRRCPLCRGIVYTFMLPENLQHLPRGHRDREAEVKRMLEKHQQFLRLRGLGTG